MQWEISNQLFDLLAANKRNFSLSVLLPSVGITTTTQSREKEKKEYNSTTSVSKNEEICQLIKSPFSTDGYDSSAITSRNFLFDRVRSDGTGFPVLIDHVLNKCEDILFLALDPFVRVCNAQRLAAASTVEHESFMELKNPVLEKKEKEKNVH